MSHRILQVNPSENGTEFSNRLSGSWCDLGMYYGNGVLTGMPGCP